MSDFARKNALKIAFDNNEINAELEEGLMSILVSLFIIQSQISEFKQNLITAKNVVRLNEIIAFENALLKTRAMFELEKVGLIIPLEQGYQSTSSRLKSILEIIDRLKKESDIDHGRFSVAWISKLENEIKFLINMLKL